MQIDVGSGDDRQTFRRIERVGRSKLIQTNLTEPNIRRTFHDLYSISLLRPYFLSARGVSLFNLFDRGKTYLR